MADTPAHKQIDKLLSDIIDLATKLRAEPWSEYDKTLQRAIVLVIKPAFGALQKAAKAISQVRPEETVNDHHDDWWNDALDEMR